MDFTAFPKIPRLSRDIVVTEKLDGTNAGILIYESMEVSDENAVASRAIPDGFGRYEHMLAGSRTRWVTPGKQDNYGFAGWVQRHAETLFALGAGHHFGEWWGQGIQRGYGLTEKRFSLFNVGRWNPTNVPACCTVVPTLYQGPFTTEAVEGCVNELRNCGSVAALGFMKPEGVIVFHTAASQMFKKTVEGDEHYKGKQA